MNQPMNGAVPQETAICGTAWQAFADPSQRIAGFSEARLRQIAVPIQLRDTACAVQTRLLLDPQPRATRGRAAAGLLLERVAAKAATTLGAQAVRRLRRLAAYADGWDEGQGRALIDESLLGLVQVLEFGDWTDLDVALFLSRDGHVLVNWPDAKGEIVELEIAKDRFTCFMASTGEELDLPIDAEAVSDVLARSR